MKRTGLTIAVSLMAFSLAHAEAITPNSNISNECGSKIKKDDVLVLDLESFDGDLEAAKGFVAEHAGEYTLASKTPELIKTKLKGALYTRKSAIKRATKEAAKRGYDVLLVLNAGTENVGTAYYNSWNGSINATGNANGSGWGASNSIKKGGAIVLMGDRAKP